MKILIPVSAVGSLVLLGLMVILNSNPAGYYDAISASVSPDQKQLFWNNEKGGVLHFFDIESQELSSVIHCRVHNLEWTRDGRKLRGIGGEYYAKKLVTIDPSTTEITSGPPANFFVNDSGADPILLGRGEYREQSNFDVHGGSQPNRTLGTNFPEDGGVTFAARSPDNKLLAVSAGGYNDPDRLEVRRLNDWSTVLSFDETATFGFFTKNSLHLIAVQSSAARIALHRFDLSTGKRIASTKETSGWIGGAAVSADEKVLAIAKLDYDSPPKIERVSVEDFKLQNEISLPARTREIIDLSFSANGEEILAISRNGSLWTWNSQTGDIKESYQFSPTPDYRWLFLAGGLTVLCIMVAFLIRVRNTSPQDPKKRPLYHPKAAWLGGGLLFEVFYLMINLGIDVLGMGLGMAILHLFLAGVALVFLIAAKLLSRRGNYRVGFCFTLMICAGAFIGMHIVSSIIAGV